MTPMLNMLILILYQKTQEFLLINIVQIRKEVTNRSFVAHGDSESLVDYSGQSEDTYQCSTCNACYLSQD